MDSCLPDHPRFSFSDILIEQYLQRHSKPLMTWKIASRSCTSLIVLYLLYEKDVKKAKVQGKWNSKLNGGVTTVPSRSTRRLRLQTRVRQKPQCEHVHLKVALFVVRHVLVTTLFCTFFKITHVLTIMHKSLLLEGELGLCESFWHKKSDQRYLL